MYYKEANNNLLRLLQHKYYLKQVDDTYDALITKVSKGVKNNRDTLDGSPLLYNFYYDYISWKNKKLESHKVIISCKCLFKGIYKVD